MRKKAVIDALNFKRFDNCVPADDVIIKTIDDKDSITFTIIDKYQYSCYCCDISKGWKIILTCKYKRKKLTKKLIKFTKEYVNSDYPYSPPEHEDKYNANTEIGWESEEVINRTWLDIWDICPSILFTVLNFFDDGRALINAINKETPDKIT